MKVTAKSGKKPDVAPVTVEYHIPESTGELVKAFGEDVIAKAAVGSIVISLQNLIRRLIEAGKTAAEIHTEVKGWKPDARTVVKQTAFQKATSSLGKLTPEERKQLLAQLSAMK